jgi:hypothetical protein
MGEATRRWTEKPQGAVPRFELEDYILARMDLQGVSVRELAMMAKIGRSRLHDGLHREVDKRVSLRMPEIAAILEAMCISKIEAMYAQELLQNNEAGIELKDLLKVISMVLGIVTGLPAQIITVVKHVDGLGFDDVRPEHGEAAQGLLMRAIEVEYQKIGNRRSKRFEEFGQE